MFTDHLIGVVSIAQDSNEQLCFLVWLGIVSKFPCKKLLSFKDKLDQLQGELNIGSFLICTVQLIKSMLLGNWTPVTCQIFQEANEGPLHFYKKAYFIKMDRDHDLIHLQYLRRRHHVINDDDTLHWYALYMPLSYLTMFELNTMTDEEESFGIIFNRANHFFLTKERGNHSQRRARSDVQQIRCWTSGKTKRI